MPHNSFFQQSKRYCLPLLMLTLMPLSSVNAEVIGLGVIPGYNGVSRAYGISADGTVVVGSSRSEGGDETAFRWTLAEGIISLGGLDGPNFRSRATTVSSDGLTIFGFSDSERTNFYEPFRWTEAEGMIALSSLGGEYFEGYAHDASADGTVVVGYSQNNIPAEFGAFRWTEAEGMIALSGLEGQVPYENLFYSNAQAISADGKVVVGGRLNIINSQQEAFRWTLGEGMVSLGLLQGTNFSEAYGVSADGAVVVGYSGGWYNFEDREAFRWTMKEGMVGLGHLPGGKGSQAYDVSPDGSIIVGRAGSQPGLHVAFRWAEQTGMQTVEDWLADYGIGTNGLRLDSALAISENGTIVGIATTAEGNSEAFLARAGGLLFLPDYLSSFKQINNTQLLSQRISRQVIPQQPFGTLIHKSKLLAKRRSEQQPVLYASNTITPEMYIDQGRDLSQDE